MLERQRDWAAKEVKSHCRAYGVGVAYAYMVYGALETKLLEYVVPASAID